MDIERNTANIDANLIEDAFAPWTDVIPAALGEPEYTEPVANPERPYPVLANLRLGRARQHAPRSRVPPPAFAAIQPPNRQKKCGIICLG